MSKCYFWKTRPTYSKAPIGLALMVVIAEAFLQHHESNALKIALEQTPSVAPRSFLRYVDDSHARFNTNDASLKFQNILNEQHPNIKYTIETEDDNKRLQFLDLDIYNTM